MKTIKIFETLIYCGVLSLSLISCADSEDDITPSTPEKNYFAVDNNATDDESILRRQFYKDNGCYLLYNDTLRHDSIGKKTDGETVYKTETIDLPYVMPAERSTAYKYTYIKDFDKKKAAVDFIEKYILPHLGVKLRPYSWLLVNSITKYTVSDASFYYDSEQETVVGNRATAVAMGTVFDMNDDDAKQFSKELSISILGPKVYAQNDSYIMPFTKYSKDLYEKSGTLDTYDDDSNMALMQKSGFISPHYTAGFIIYNTFPTKQEDVEAFAKLAAEKSEQEVIDMYNNDIITAKYLAMRQIILNLGYIF